MNQLAFVGRLVPKKGASDLLEALAGVPRGQRPHAVFAGDGPQRAQLQRTAAELGVDAEFIGMASPAQVMDLLDRSRLLCVPSRRADNGDAEGFGMVFAEAAARGLPSVSYRSGGVPEAIHHGTTGLLAPEGDVDALRENIVALTSDGDLAASLGAAARRRVVADFDVRTQTGQVEDLYDGLLT